MARSPWPDAPPQHQADDGKAVGLLLAGLAHQDDHQGLDRAAMIEQHQAMIEGSKKKALAASLAHQQILPQAASQAFDF